MRHECNEPARFLRTSYDSRDSVAIFLKFYVTGRTRQHVMAVARVFDPRFLRWLHVQNGRLERWNVYVSVNAIAPGRWTRTRENIGAVRHVFLDVDADAAAVIDRTMRRFDLPFPSYVIHSSPGRLHLLWRVCGVVKDDVEPLQRQLARELGADCAATACSQMTRLPGFFNQKYPAAHRIAIEYTAPDRVFTRDEFPDVRAAPTPVAVPQKPRSPAGVLERARQYLSQIEPAVAGQHGNQRTFQVACRLVRGFALNDIDAFTLLADWNARCEPPWTACELGQMLRNARQYGREPIGGLLESP
jgi:hypothetical protein